MTTREKKKRIKTCKIAESLIVHVSTIYELSDASITLWNTLKSIKNKAMRMPDKERSTFITWKKDFHILDLFRCEGVTILTLSQINSWWYFFLQVGQSTLLRWMLVLKSKLYSTINQSVRFVIVLTSWAVLPKSPRNQLLIKQLFA